MTTDDTQYCVVRTDSDGATRSYFGHDQTIAEEIARRFAERDPACTWTALPVAQVQKLPPWKLL